MKSEIDEFSPRCLDKRCEVPCALYVAEKLPEHRLTANTLRMKVGQMIFHRGEPVPAHASYAAKGQYNGDTAATPSKGVK